MDKTPRWLTCVAKMAAKTNLLMNIPRLVGGEATAQVDETKALTDMGIGRG
jgi:hypothetical protein